MARPKKRKKKRSQKVRRHRPFRDNVPQGAPWSMDMDPEMADISPEEMELLSEMTPVLLEFFSPHILADKSAFMETMLDPVVALFDASFHLADEPELQDVYFQPVRAAVLWAEAMHDRGMDPEDVEQLSEEEREDLFAAVMTEIAAQLLTPEMRALLIERLTVLRSRLRRDPSRQHDLAAAAAAQWSLQNEKQAFTWASLGLIQRILDRSLEAGLAIANRFAEHLPSDAPLDPDMLDALDKRTLDALSRELKSLIASFPGLEDFILSSTDKVWEEGMLALREGRLYLNMFTKEELAELEAAFTQFVDQMDTAQKSTDSERFLNSLEEMFRPYFPPERLERLREDILSHLIKEAKDWKGFLLMVASELRHRDVFPLEVVVNAFLGEMKRWIEERERDASTSGQSSLDA